MEENYSSIVYTKDQPEPEMDQKHGTKENLVAILLLLALLSSVTVSAIIFNNSKEDEVIVLENIIKKEEIAKEVFSNVDVEANAYVVYDINHKTIVASRNKDVQLPLASLSKIMTALLAMETLGEDQIITINNDNLAIDGDSGLVEGERWNVKDLLEFTLIVSSNDGANALASAVSSIKRDGNDNKIDFKNLMNAKAKELDLDQTYFLNESGLDIDEYTQSGSYGSSYDVARLFSYAITKYPELFGSTIDKEIVVTSENSYIHDVKNTNQETLSIPFILASKTGYTDLAGGNLVVAFDAGMMQPYIIAVLGSSKDGRFTDVNKLYNATIDYLDRQNK